MLRHASFLLAKLLSIATPPVLKRRSIQEIGLGRAKEIEALDIWWPVSDTRQTFKTVAANQFIEIKELAPDYQLRPLRSYPLFIKPARPQEKKSHHNY
jgi:ASPIC and UnbV